MKDQLIKKIDVLSFNIQPSFITKYDNKGSDGAIVTREQYHFMQPEIKEIRKEIMNLNLSVEETAELLELLVGHYAK